MQLALLRALTAHLALDGLLSGERFRRADGGPGAVRSPRLWASALVYAAILTFAILPDLRAPRLLPGFLIIGALRGVVLIAQAQRRPSHALLLPAVQVAGVIVASWCLTAAAVPFAAARALLGAQSLWIVLLAYALALWPAGTAVAALAKRWLAETQGDTANRGLQNGGLWIGRLERLLTLSFILTDHPQAIAALIVAKGVIRFPEIKEAKDRRVAEYIFIGSMTSFGIALALGWAARQMLRNG